MDKQALHSAPRRSFIAAAASVGLALPAAGAAPVAAGEKTETLERGRTRVVGFAEVGPSDATPTGRCVLCSRSPSSRRG